MFATNKHLRCLVIIQEYQQFLDNICSKYFNYIDFSIYYSSTVFLGLVAAAKGNNVIRWIELSVAISQYITALPIERRTGPPLSLTRLPSAAVKFQSSDTLPQL